MSYSTKPYLSEEKIFSKWIPVIILAVIMFLCFIIGNYIPALNAVAMILLIFGSLHTASVATIAIQMSRNLEMLNDLKLVDQMCKETPENCDNSFAFTETFVWGIKRNLCIPISNIDTINIGITRYVNSATKNNAYITVHTKCNRKFDLLYFHGTLTEKNIEDIKLCAYQLLQRNPEIKIEKR